MLKILGVTGGIGAGKTIVCKAFACLGIPIYHADQRSKLLMASSLLLKNEIIDFIGPKSFSKSGVINRKYIASIIFNDPEKLKKLNSLVHPIVAQDFKIWALKHNKTSAPPFIIKEAAIIIEANSQKSVDYLANVTANENIRIKRVLKRDKHRKIEEIKKIMSVQMPDEIKNKHCDFIINNNNEPLLPQIVHIYNFIKSTL